MGIIALRPVERAETDVLRVAGMDAAGAGARLDADLEEIAEMLSRVALAWAEGGQAELRVAAAALGAHSGVLGLHRLARVARTVERLSREPESVALAANVARLDRLGHATLEEIWCLQDLPG